MQWNTRSLRRCMTSRRALHRGGVRFKLARFHVTLEEGERPQVNKTTRPRRLRWQQKCIDAGFGSHLEFCQQEVGYGIAVQRVQQGLFTANLKSVDLIPFWRSQADADVHYQTAVWPRTVKPVCCTSQQ